jgi:hypothetical protein
MRPSTRNCVTVAAAAGALLLSATLSLADNLSGSSALQALAGKSFQFKCDDQMYGYGRFVSRTSAWASYSYTREELERRASAAIRVNGNELCFQSDGGIGEVCAVFATRGAGVYRATSKDGWCDLRIGGAVARE